jgi:outer membrane lipoprotein LolB
VRRIQLLLLLPLLLAACSTLRTPGAPSAGQERLYAEREQQLGLYQAWSIEGKLALTNGEDGGSGYFRWERGTNTDHMDFHGALGRGAWRLDAGPDGAELELANGELYRSASLGELVQRHAGWRIPVDYLAWWVRGLAAPARIEGRALDDSGRLLELRQAGWLIRFDRYRSFGDVDLPVKLTASREEARLRLAVRDWTVETGAVGGS